MKCIFKNSLKLLFLVIIMFISLAISSSILGITNSSEPSSNSVLPILTYCFINTIVITLFIVNSRFNGIRLIGITSLVFFSIQYFMTQIETLYFNYAINMPIEQILRVVISGAISAIIFCSIAVIVLGKFKKGLTAPAKKTSISIPFTVMFFLSIIYLFIYFIFGYFIAWQFVDIRLFYTGSSDIVNIFKHLANILHDDTWLPLFQIFRGFLWASIGLIIINSLVAKKNLQYLISSLLFGVLVSSPLLFPNSYMPQIVRLGHSIELFTSMVLFGALSTFVIRKVVK